MDLSYKIPKEITDWINGNSTKVQHLLDVEPRVTRWWFADIGKVIQAINLIQDHKEPITYRMICLAMDSLYIQHGEFE